MNLNFFIFLSHKLSSSGRRGFLSFARIVAFLSVMLGSLALIVSLSVLDGYQTELTRNAEKFTSHIQIFSMTKQPIADYKQVIARIKAEEPKVADVQPVLQRECMLKNSENVDGVLLKGIDEVNGAKKIKPSLKEGTFSFASATAKELVIGEKLAHKLKAKVGDKVLLMAATDTISDVDFFPQIEKFTVIGIYKTGFHKYDEYVIYTPLAAAAAFLHYGENKATNLEIDLKDIADVKRLTPIIEETVGFPYYALNVFELHSSMFAWIDLQKAPIPIVLGLISIVAVFNIITILLVTIVEKTRSIGILRSLGMKNRGILALFVTQGVAIGTAGAVTGCLLGFLFGFTQNAFKIISLNSDIYFLDALPVDMSAWHFVLVLSASIFCSFLAALVPSLIAVRISPVKSLRFR